MSVFKAKLLSITSREEAEQELTRISVDPCGITLMASKMLTRCIHLSKIKCGQANIIKQEMLAVGGDAAVSRGAAACKVEHTDVILMGTEKQLQKVAAKLALQPFGLARLAEELLALLDYLLEKHKLWVLPNRSLQIGSPLVMGILNVTPDSFSDGGNYLNLDLAVEHALKMEAEGADIIDIGGESTRPGASLVSEEDELARVLPVIEKLASKLSVPISIDTYKGAVAKKAMQSGAEIINDISGFVFDPSMVEVAAESNAAVILMHTRGTPDLMQKNTSYSNLVEEIIESLRQSVSTADSFGIGRDKIAVDPGIGFGKTVSGNLEILHKLKEFKSLGLPILVGASRKSFIGAVLGDERYDRLVGTAATAALAIANGASILRVHDVREMRAAADMAYAVMTEGKHARIA